MNEKKAITTLTEDVLRNCAEMVKVFNFSLGHALGALSSSFADQRLIEWAGTHQDIIAWHRHDENDSHEFTSVEDIYRSVDIYKTSIPFPVLITALNEINATHLIPYYAHAFYSQVVNTETMIAVQVVKFTQENDLDIKCSASPFYNVTNYEQWKKC